MTMKQLALLALLYLAAVAAPYAVAAEPSVLTWDGVVNATAYHVERKAAACTASGTYTEIGTTAQGALTFTDNNTAEGATYCYRVAASNPAGKSGYSNEAGKTVPFVIPAAPANLLVR